MDSKSKQRAFQGSQVDGQRCCKDPGCSRPRVVILCGRSVELQNGVDLGQDEDEELSTNLSKKAYKRACFPMLLCRFPLQSSAGSTAPPRPPPFAPPRAPDAARSQLPSPWPSPSRPWPPPVEALKWRERDPILRYFLALSLTRGSASCSGLMSTHASKGYHMGVLIRRPPD